jgi:hypothetical protein
VRRTFQWAFTIFAIFAMARLTSCVTAVTEIGQPPGTSAAREDALNRARVFVPSPPAIRALDLTANPNDVRPFPRDAVIECRYVPEPSSGTTPKFDCELEDGQVVKVKYGRTPEIAGEVGATRLLAALGFGADHVSLVQTVRCRGCPPAPFRLRQLAELLLVASLFERIVDYSRVRGFQQVAVERKLEGQAIKAGLVEGWEWSDLESVDSTRGASRAELDALRLIAVILAHWDNKAQNQRLLCLDPAKDRTRCRTPLLMLQDVGSTFGPRKVDLEPWAATPIWADASGCVATMDSLPYQGATFRPVEISEQGRQLLAGKLRQLSLSQMHDLFSGAGFPPTGEEGDVSGWVRALSDKIRQVADRPPCPSRP